MYGQGHAGGELTIDEYAERGLFERPCGDRYIETDDGGGNNGHGDADAA